MQQIVTVPVTTTTESSFILLCTTCFSLNILPDKNVHIEGRHGIDKIQ